ncbi:MAG: tail fiber domain-containing protein [Bacteroidota bacterium]
MKTIIFILLLAVCILPAYSQNITNTLGTGGVFTIKDASNSYLTLSQSDGLLSLNKNLNLLTTTSSSLGVITKGGNRFIHDFAPAGSQGCNTFIGINSGNFTMSGTGYYSSYNTGIGNYSLQNLTTGYHNTAMGYGSLNSNTTGFWNTAVGKSSLQNNLTGSSNTAVGEQSLYHNTTSNLNAAVGFGSLYSNTTGGSNTAMGASSLYSDSTGANNTAVGEGSLQANTTGHDNTAVGYWAGYNMTTGYNNTLIGSNAQSSAANINNEITLGNGSVTSLRCAVTTITSLSDARDKKNINDLNLGIDFLMKLKPRLFNWDKREWYKDNKSDGSKMQKTLTAGFIAQELDEVQTKENAEWLNLVLRNNPDKLEATPGNLLPVMVKAIQELKDKLDKYEQMQVVLINEIDKLKSSKEK